MDLKKSMCCSLLRTVFFGFTLLLGLLTSHLSLANNSIILPESSFDLQITPYLSIFEDESNTLSVDDILTAVNQQKFTPRNRDTFRFSVSDSSFWLRFSITNPHSKKQSLVFSVSNNRIDNIDFYEYKEGHLNHHKSGSKAPTKAKGGHRQAYPFLIDINEKSKQTYFIKIHSTTPIDTTFRLQSDDQFLQSQQLDFTLLGIALGLIIATFSFFMFAWYFYRFHIAILSALYCASIFFFIPLWLGQWAAWFPHIKPWNDDLTLAITMVSIILQILIVMQLKWKAPSTKLVFRILFTLLITNVIVFLTLFFFPVGLTIFLTQCSIIITFTATSLIFIFFKNKYKRAQKFLLLSHLTLVIGVIINLLTTLDVLALNFINIWAVFILPLVVILGTLAFNLSAINQYRQTRDLQLNTGDSFLSKLLSKLGHDFRTPINGVMGMSELLADTHLSHTQRDYLETINLAGEDLLHLVNDMADFSKLRNGEFQINNRPFDLSNCLTHCMNRYQQEARRKQIELVLDIAEDISPRLLGDQDRLQTIITNLVSQSLRHTESGELELSVFRVGSGKQEGLFFQIQLTGSLIDHDELRRLFRTMEGPKEPFNGMNLNQGLGLIIVKRIVALLQGSIEVETLTYQGCSITLFLPIKEEFSSKLDEPDNYHLLTGKRILIVDDNSTFRRVMEKQAKRWGMKTDNTHSGKEALALMRNKANLDEAYDYILIDQDMPIMNGIQLTERLMADDSIRPKPLRIMLTGLGINNSNQNAIDAGIQKIIHKPISGRHLKEALLELVP